jgi:hypothetical protein
MRQRDRLGQPPPDRGNDRQRYEEKRQRRTNGDWSYPPEDLSIMVQPSMIDAALDRDSKLLSPIKAAPFNNK